MENAHCQFVGWQPVYSGEPRQKRKRKFQKNFLLPFYLHANARRSCWVVRKRAHKNELNEAHLPAGIGHLAIRTDHVNVAIVSQMPFGKIMARFARHRY